MIKRRNSSGQVLLVVLLWVLVLALGYVVSNLWWSMWLYYGVHWSGAENWTYLYTCTHWGALAPFVVG